jgi:hypothetical protein
MRRAAGKYDGAPTNPCRALSVELEKGMKHSPKRSGAVGVLFLAVALIITAHVVVAADKKVRESKAEAVRVLNQSATMYESRDYLVTQVTGPVGKEGIPAVIRL